MPEQARRRPLWLRIALPLVVLAVALVIGSGVLSGKAQTQARPRPPSRPSSAALRASTSPWRSRRNQPRWPCAMRSNGRWPRAVRPPRSNRHWSISTAARFEPRGFPIIWIVPIVLGAGALGVIGVLFWRRSRQFSATRDAQTLVEAP